MIFVLAEKWVFESTASFARNEHTTWHFLLRFD